MIPIIKHVELTGLTCELAAAAAAAAFLAASASTLAPA